MEFWNDDLIAPLPVHSRPHPVVNRLTTVQRQDNIGHLPVDIFYRLIIEQDTVGRNRKAKYLVALFFQGTGVFHSALHRIHRHERLPAKEINLDISTLSGFCHDPVDGPFGRFKVHGHPMASAEVACRGKTIFAPQVTVMRYMETKRLDHCRLGQGHSGLRIDVFVIRKEKALVLKTSQFLPSLG